MYDHTLKRYYLLATITLHNVTVALSVITMDKKKILEAVILAVVIISVWMIMFLPVLIYFLVSMSTF